MLDRIEHLLGENEEDIPNLAPECPGKNHILFAAIYDRFSSISELCRIKTELQSDESYINSLLNLKLSPKKNDGNYRAVCIRLESALGIPAEDLFPDYLYDSEPNVEEIPLSNLLPDTREKIMLLMHAHDLSPEDESSVQDLKRRISTLLKTLTYREREVLKVRYGLEDCEPLTLEEVAKAFRVTHERVRQIECKAIGKMRHHVRSDQLRGFLPEGHDKKIVIE